MPLRITTWNVNGIRNPFGYQPWREKRTFQAMFDTLEADIVVMQETKIQRKDLRDDMVLVPGWDVYFSLPKHKKGYSGVAIYTRCAKCCPIRAEEGITGVLCRPNSSTKFRDLPADQQIGGYPRPGAVDEQTLDAEGRCVILEFPAFVLIGVYSPAARDETRTAFRQAYIDAIDSRVRNLVALGKQVVLCGDLNIVRDEIDTAAKEDTTREFVSTPSRRVLNQLVFGGRVVGERDADPVLWDLCREFHPARPGMYTCWETKKNARPGNFGSRIDYVLCSAGLKEWFVDANIQEGLFGSDHCPVYAAMGDVVRGVHIEDVMNPPGMFVAGQRQREWSPKDLLPTSAKLLPEFRRQSIRDMFKTATTGKGSPSDATTNPQNPQSGPRSKNEQTNRPGAPATSTTAPGSSTKRQAEPLGGPKKKVARENSGSAASPGGSQKKKENSGLAQSSLKGFFKPKTDANQSTDGPPDSSTKQIPRQRSVSDDAIPSDVANPDSSTKQIPQQSAVSGDAIPSDTAESSAKAWSKLLGKRVVPTCEHGEDCQLLVTKKPGVNCGRSFFMCARPLGPSGDKEQGTEFRCRTFVWSSDWRQTGPSST